jgi:hypothetical protein
MLDVNGLPVTLILFSDKLNFEERYHIVGINAFVAYANVTRNYRIRVKNIENVCSLSAR